MLKICIFSVILTNISSVKGATILDSNSIRNIDINNSSDIYVYNGKSITTLNSLTSLFSISLKDDEYVTSKFYRVISQDSTEVPVYSSASTNNKIGNIPVGSILIVSNQLNGFSEIFFNDQTAYISSSSIISSGFLSSPETAITDDILTKYAKITISNGTSIRATHSLDSKILKTIPQNNYVDVLGSTNTWLKVSYNDIIGYIPKYDATLTNTKQQNEKNSGQAVVDFAKQFLGNPYIYGGTDLSKGTDCSGFTYSVFKHFGINLNRVSRDQFLNGVPIDKPNLKIGDLVFFNTGGTSTISHIGIYMGNGEYIHSSQSSTGGVIVSNMNNSYSSSMYYGARRVLS